MTIQRSFTGIIGKILLLLFIVCYFQLFKLSVFPSIFGTLFRLIGASLLLVSVILGIIYFPHVRNKMHFSALIIVMLISSVPSLIMARYFHQQSITVSLVAYNLLFFYLIYFYVHIYRIPVRFVIHSIVGIGLLAVVLYYLQLFFYPRMIMDIYFLKGRGTIRFFVPGMICTQATYFYFLNRFFQKKKIIHMLLGLASLSIFILQGTRQLIFALIFLTMVYILFTKKVRSKILISLLFSIALAAVFFAFQDIFFELTRISSSQAQNISGGIRLRAIKYFLTDFMPSAWAYLFGNGDPGMNSLYSQKMSFLVFKYGFYLSDIGIIGDYVRYGLIFTLAGLAMIVKSVRFKISSDYSYLKYYILSQCFTFFTGYGIFGGVDIFIMLILYVFDMDRSKKHIQENEHVNEAV